MAEAVPTDAGLDYLGPVRPREAQISEPDGVERLLEAGRRAIHTVSQFLSVSRGADEKHQTDELRRLEGFIADHLRQPDVQALLRQPALRDTNHPGISTPKRLGELLKRVAERSETIRGALQTCGLGEILKPIG